MLWKRGRGPHEVGESVSGKHAPSRIERDHSPKVTENPDTQSLTSVT